MSAAVTPLRTQRRRRALLGLVPIVAAAVFALSATPVFSADSGSVAATVTVAAPCLTIGGASSIDFGASRFSTLTDRVAFSKPVGTATMTNCGGANQNIFARVTNAVGDGNPPALWQPGGACSGPNQFTAEAERVQLLIALGPANAAFGQLGASTTAGLGFRFSMPCTGSSGAGQTMTFSYIYTATF